MVSLDYETEKVGRSLSSCEFSVSPFVVHSRCSFSLRTRE